MSILAPNSHILYRDTYTTKDHNQQLWSVGSFLNTSKSFGFGFDQRKNSECKKIFKRDCKANSFLPDLSRPQSVQMEPITDSDHLDQILAKATDHCQPIVIDWMATWCRKCIYIKPKLEKLAAEFDTKLTFYYVDVNNVPQALVKRGNISKMPTIQIWKDGEMKDEVIGGHKAWLVLEEVREMVKKFRPLLASYLG